MKVMVVVAVTFLYGGVTEKEKKMTATSVTFFDGFVAKKGDGNYRHFFWWFCYEKGDGSNVVAFFYGGGGMKKVMATGYRHLFFFSSLVLLV